MSALDGRIVALIGGGTALDRALAVACAEAGADLALATTAANRDQEYALNSIANEAWNIGRAQFVRVLDATDAAAVAAFADEVCDRYGRCDVLICAHDQPANAPLDELSPDEWYATIAANLTAPFLAVQAFGRLMEREGRGLVLVVIPDHEEADAAVRAARGGLATFCGAVAEAWGTRGVEVELAPVDPARPEDAGNQLVALLSDAVGGW